MKTSKNVTNSSSELSGGYYDYLELKALGFESVGYGTKVSKRVEIQDPTRIELGSNVRLDSFVTVTTGESGYLKIGSNTHVADGVRIVASAGVEIGEYVGLAPKVTILSSSDDYSGEFMVGPLAPEGTSGGTKGKVTISDFVVLGTGSVVFPGKILHEGVSVGALSLVNRDLHKWGVYFGVPVRFVSPRSQEMLHKLKESKSSREG